MRSKGFQPVASLKTKTKNNPSKFVIKRGWRDDSTKELEETKKANGLADRADIQTWMDYHDVDEGRVPRTNGSFGV